VCWRHIYPAKTLDPQCRAQQRAPLMMHCPVRRDSIHHSNVHKGCGPTRAPNLAAELDGAGLIHERTRISCCAAVDRTACAAFRKVIHRRCQPTRHETGLFFSVVPRACSARMRDRGYLPKNATALQLGAISGIIFTASNLPPQMVSLSRVRHLTGSSCPRHSDIQVAYLPTNSR
jgi:hypothetical protein